MRVPVTQGPKPPIVTTDAYRIFVSFMFAAAMIGWGATFLGMDFSIDDQTKITVHLPSNWTFVAGILYAGVLICFYWIYTEKIAISYLPTNVLWIGCDFIAFSFMTGAATAWRSVAAFNVLATLTLVFLFARFLKPASLEIAQYKLGNFSARDCLMTQILFVYGLVFILVTFFLFGVMTEAPGYKGDYNNLGITLKKIALEIVENVNLYYAISAAMILGIIVTVLYVPRHLLVRRRVVPRSTISETELPILVPAYGDIPEDRLSIVAKHVFKGEKRFRNLLDSIDPRGSSPFHFHQSHVHAYRDVETQAFIMAMPAVSPNEIELRSMWVYLAHWFDDLFDYRYSTDLARIILGGEFQVSDALKELDTRLETLWQRAIEQTDVHANWDSSLFELGIRRLMFGGPMFSPACANRHSEITALHRDLVISNLSEQWGIKEIVNNTKDRHLNYTSKVVVEIWDSFNSNLDFNVSMAMNLFYAPGLFYHDADSEEKHNEIALEPSENERGELETLLERVFDCIDGFPLEKRTEALKPVSMFVRAFDPVLTAEGLSGKYRRWKV